jgi:hypothetical protein
VSRHVGAVLCAGLNVSVEGIAPGAGTSWSARCVWLTCSTVPWTDIGTGKAFWIARLALVVLHHIPIATSTDPWLVIWNTCALQGMLCEALCRVTTQTVVLTRSGACETLWIALLELLCILVVVLVKVYTTMVVFRRLAVSSGTTGPDTLALDI